MASHEVAEFLDNYRRLEAAAASFLRVDARSGVIPRLIRHPKMEPYRDELDCCREVRNLLTHEVKVGGAVPLIPGPGMNAFLRRVIEILENPPRVRDRMTPRERLYTVSPDFLLADALVEMEKRSLSRVPCLSGERVVGMLSVEAVFRVFLDRVTVDDTTTIAAIMPYLALDVVPSVAYRFVSPELLLEEAESLFSGAYGRNCKIRALLVTDRAAPSAPLLGIVSPYDVLDTGKK